MKQNQKYSRGKIDDVFLQYIFYSIICLFLWILFNTDGCQNSKYNVSRKREVVQTIQDIYDVTSPGGSKSWESASYTV